MGQRDRPGTSRLTNSRIGAIHCDQSARGRSPESLVEARLAEALTRVLSGETRWAGCPSADKMSQAPTIHDRHANNHQNPDRLPYAELMQKDVKKVLRKRKECLAVSNRPRRNSGRSYAVLSGLDRLASSSGHNSIISIRQKLRGRFRAPRSENRPSAFGQSSLFAHHPSTSSRNRSVPTPVVSRHHAPVRPNYVLRLQRSPAIPRRG